jgi:hypothetical protein
MGQADIPERHVPSDFTTDFTSLICHLLAVKFDPFNRVDQLVLAQQMFKHFEYTMNYSVTCSKTFIAREVKPTYKSISYKNWEAPLVIILSYTLQSIYC